jgi:hypothetical protein
MKKMFLFSAMAAGLLTSCVQTETIAPELTETEKEIKFQTVVAKQGTRAIITGVDYDENAPSFGTYAFHNESNSNLLPGTGEYITNAEIVHKNDGTTHYWGPASGSYQWPKQGSLTFYSYSPFYYQEDKTTPLNPTVPEIGQYGFRFIDYDVAAHQETDLMVADIQYGQTANVTHGAPNSLITHTGVKTIFRHKLALIGGFILSTSDDYDGTWDGININTANDGNLRFKILNITFKNIATKGTFTSEGIKGTDASIIPEKWEISSDPGLKDYVWYDSKTAGTGEYGGQEFGHVESKQLHLYKSESSVGGHRQADPTIANGYLLAIPQQFLENNNAALEITDVIENFANGSWQVADKEEDKITKSVKLYDIHKEHADLGWAANKKIVYSLKFSTQEIRWAPSIVGWENADFSVKY